MHACRHTRMHPRKGTHTASDNVEVVLLLHLLPLSSCACCSDMACFVHCAAASSIISGRVSVTLMRQLPSPMPVRAAQLQILTAQSEISHAQMSCLRHDAIMHCQLKIQSDSTCCHASAPRKCHGCLQVFDMSVCTVCLGTQRCTVCLGTQKNIVSSVSQLIQNEVAEESFRLPLAFSYISKRG